MNAALLAPDAVPPDLGGLLDLAARGDVAAAAAVYDRVSVSAYRLAYLVAGEPELAADVCRRGFAHLWGAWAATVDDDRPLFPQVWALTVMYQFARQHTLAPVTSGRYRSATSGLDATGLPWRGRQRRPFRIIRGAADALDKWRPRVP